MSKQDRTHSRTPADTESKFLLNLGKSFAEILGIATDARTTAENARSELSKSVAEINKELTDKGAKIELVVGSGIVDKDGSVQASIIISAINDQSEAKISAERITFKGKQLDLEVEDTHIKGKLTAQVLNIDDIKAENVDISGKITSTKGKVGDWVLDKAEIPYRDLNGKESYYESQSALYSDKQRYENDSGFVIYETWLTAKGVYVKVSKYSCGVEINDVYYEELLTGTNYYFDRWGDILAYAHEESPTETWTFVLEDGSSVIKEVCIK